MKDTLLQHAAEIEADDELTFKGRTWSRMVELIGKEPAENLISFEPGLGHTPGRAPHTAKLLRGAAERIEELECQYLAMSNGMATAKRQRNEMANQRDAALADLARLTRENEGMAKVVDVARRVVSRGIHQRYSRRDVMLGEGALLINDVEALAKLADAIAAAAQAEKEQP